MGTIVPTSTDEMIDVLENFILKMTWDEYRRFARELSSHDLTYPQFHTLVAIHRNNSQCTMGVLADETNQVSATVTGIIDRLVERGLVERWRHPDDRRQVLVHLTDAGRAKLNDVVQLRRHYMADVLDKLDEQTRNQLALSLQQYMHALETLQYNP